MIGRLRGQLAYKQPPVLMLDVQGIGYELEASLSTFYQLPEVGAEISLYTHLAAMTRICSMASPPWASAPCFVICSRSVASAPNQRC